MVLIKKENTMDTIFIKSKVTGGHYTFINPKGGTPFTNKMTEAMLIKIRSDDIVADIGAYVGEYSLYAANSGAKTVMSFEASPNTFKVLQMNKKKNMQIFNFAVVGDDRDEVQLYLSSGIGVTNSIVKKLRKSGNILVPAIKYEDVVRSATVVKIDVEGAEYTYNIIQPQLRAIIIEFHPIVGVDWKNNAEIIMSNLISSGFKCLIRPHFTSGWDLHGAWIR